MRTTKYFLVKPDIAERAGVIDSRYHTSEGLMVLNEQDMGRVRLTPVEYQTGVVERIVDEAEATHLIEEAGRKMGRLVEDAPAEGSEESLPIDSEVVVESGAESSAESDAESYAESVADCGAESVAEDAATEVEQTNNEAEEELNHE